MAVHILRVIDKYSNPENFKKYLFDQLTQSHELDQQLSHPLTLHAEDLADELTRKREATPKSYELTLIPREVHIGEPFYVNAEIVRTSDDFPNTWVRIDVTDEVSIELIDA